MLEGAQRDAEEATSRMGRGILENCEYITFFSSIILLLFFIIIQPSTSTLFHHSCLLLHQYPATCLSFLFASSLAIRTLASDQLIDSTSTSTLITSLTYKVEGKSAISSTLPFLTRLADFISSPLITTHPLNTTMFGNILMLSTIASMALAQTTTTTTLKLAHNTTTTTLHPAQTTTTTTLSRAHTPMTTSLFLNSPPSMTLAAWDASVINVDSTATTYALECLTNCGDYPHGMVRASSLPKTLPID